MNFSQRTAWALTLAGLIPFWALALMVLRGHGFVQNQALLGQIRYAAIILSFLGAVYWGAALVRKDLSDKYVAAMLAFGISPSLIAWAATQFEPRWALITLMGGLIAAWVADLKLAPAAGLPVWYGSMRLAATAGAVCALGLSLFVISQVPGY